jgi:hypothetical protein
MMFRNLTIWIGSFVLLFGLSCGLPKESSLTAPKKTPPPDWVMQHPISPSHYIGVAVANKNTNPVDYASIATKNALNNMASTVSVRITGQSFLNTMETNKVFSEDFSSSINTTTDIVFENYETAGIYENENDYWVYLRISKMAYQEQQARKKNEVLQNAYALYERSLEPQKRNQINTSIDLLLHALFTLKPYWNEQNNFTTPNGDNLLLDQQIYSDIQKILQEIESSCDESAIMLTAQNHYHQTIPLKVNGHGGSPAVGAPFTYHYPTDKYTRPKKVTTNGQGMVMVDVINVPFESQLPKLEFSFDTEALIPTDLDQKICRNLLKGAEANPLIVPIHIVKPTFYVESIEKNFGDNGNQTILMSTVQGFLAQKGFAVTSKNKADYWITIEADTKNGGLSSEFISALLDMTLVLTDNQEQIVRYQNNTNTIKGVQLSLPSAGAEAYKKGKLKLEDEWLKQMLQSIL